VAIGGSGSTPPSIPGRGEPADDLVERLGELAHTPVHGLHDLLPLGLEPVDLAEEPLDFHLQQAVLLAKALALPLGRPRPRPPLIAFVEEGGDEAGEHVLSLGGPPVDSFPDVVGSRPVHGGPVPFSAVGRRWQRRHRVPSLRVSGYEDDGVGAQIFVRAQRPPALEAPPLPPAAFLALSPVVPAAVHEDLHSRLAGKLPLPEHEAVRMLATDDDDVADSVRAAVVTGDGRRGGRRRTALASPHGEGK
jgi:hypothetical protein